MNGNNSIFQIEFHSTIRRGGRLNVNTDVIPVQSPAADHAIIMAASELGLRRVEDLYFLSEDDNGAHYRVLPSNQSVTVTRVA